MPNLFRLLKSYIARRFGPGQHQRFELVGVLLIITMAAALRFCHLDRVPPGLHHDEVINGQIAQHITGERFVVVHPLGGGRETLYHVLLAGSSRLLGGGVLAMRLPSVLLGLAGVLAVYFLARRVLGTAVALVAAAGMSVTFWHIALSRAILRAVIVAPLTALVMLVLWAAMEEKSPRRRYALSGLGGVLAGLVAYTYTGAFVFFPFVLTWILYRFLVNRTSRQVGVFSTQSLRLSVHLKSMLLGLFVAAAVAAPVVVVYLTQPGSHSRVDLLGREGSLAALRAGDVGPLLGNIVAVLGMFVVHGDPQWHYNIAGRPVFGPVGGVLLVIGFGVAVWRWRDPRFGIWPLWLLFALVPSVLSDPAPHFVRTVTAQVPGFVLYGLGAVTVWNWAVRRNIPRTLVAGAALLVFGGGAVWHAYDYLHVWKLSEPVQTFHQTDLATAARYLDIHPEYVDAVMVGFYMNEDDPWWRSGRVAMPFMLRRRDIRVRWFQVPTAWIVGADALYFVSPQTELPGAVIEPLHPWLDEWPEPDQARLDKTLPSVPFYQPGPVISPGLEHTWMTTPGTSMSSGTEPAVFGGKLVLKGYRYQYDEQRGRLEVVTVWQVVERLPMLHVFVHLLDAQGRLIDQDDRHDVRTDTLYAGDVFVQYHAVSLAEEAWPAIGWYDPETGTRLLVGGTAVDRVLLASVAAE